MATALSVPTIDMRERIPDAVIGEIVNRIARRFQPIKIILFGSYALGKPRPESDVDLLVIMNTPQREIQQAMEIRQFLNPLFALDILVYTPEHLKQRIALCDPFLCHILEYGVTQYESTDN